MALVPGEDIASQDSVTITDANNGLWGLKWLQIDVGSLQHLRRLIELNTNDPTMLTRELSELG